MSGLQIEKVTSTIGARVEGVDLRTPLTETERDAILAALVEHHVLFFRDQDITPVAFAAFSRRVFVLASPASPVVVVVLGVLASAP